MTFIRKLVYRPALVSVIYLIALMFGLFSYSKLPIDLLPDMQAPVVSVVTAYPGASALDVEDKISQPLEGSLGSLSDLKEISSISRENVSILTLVFTSKTDISEAANDVRQNLEELKGRFPKDAESPRVMKYDFGQMPIITFSIRSEGGDIRQMRTEIEEKFLDPLRRVPGVGSVNLSNAPERIVRVDVHRDRLYAHGLTMSEVGQLIGSSNLNIPAGGLDVGDMNFSMRMLGEARSLDELRSMPLMQSPVGDGMVHLGDLADVRMDLEDSPEVVIVDGETAVMGFVRKTSEANTVAVTDRALALFRVAEDRLGNGTRIRILEDGSSLIKGTISNLQKTVFVGALLVALIVFLFLRRIGPTIIVALAIPASMIVAFLAVFMMGYTLNAVTLIAMSLSVGLVVDNGVVALENISRKIDEGIDPMQAAHEGASEVGAALVASTTTTLVIFAPMMFISGIVGQMFSQLAIVMIVTISASLVVSLTLTPTLAARLVKRDSRRTVEETSREKWWERSYVRLLDQSMRRPWFTLVGSGLVGVATVVLLSMLGTDFLPKDDVGQVELTIEMPVGSSVDESVEIGERYADLFRRQAEVETVSLRAGGEGSNLVRVRARLCSHAERERGDLEIGRSVMDGVGDLPEVVNISMSRDGSGAGALGALNPIVVEVLGNEMESLQATAMKIRRSIQAIPGTSAVNADLFQTRPELQIVVSRAQSIRAGLPTAVVGQELRMAMSGAQVTRYTGGSKPMDVVLRLREEDRSLPTDWRRIPIRTSSGSLAELGALASLQEGESPIEIKRKDKARMIAVSMELDGRSLGDVAKDVEAMLSELELPDGIYTQIGGQIKDQRESFGDMGLLMSMGLCLVYLVLVAQFESWSDPFVIMFSVPFAATGAFLALLVTGTNLSVTSFLGLVILIGVVVNNAIVLIDYVKILRSRGLSVVEAVKAAGQRRLRPVLITTLTTSGGMLPLAMTKGDGEQLWGPMGKTALGGLLVSSVVTLVLVPTMYVILARWQEKRKEKSSMQEAAK
jgi:hydrophobic/amphiphilic exporter-1 (mainly G- bacteria), HAE1 family